MNHESNNKQIRTIINVQKVENNDEQHTYLWMSIWQNAKGSINE